MHPDSSRVELILVPIDFSDVTERVIEAARLYARALQSRVFLIHVVEPDMPLIAYEPGPLPVIPTPATEIHEKEKSQLRLLRDQLAGDGLEVSSEQMSGNVADKIVEWARREGANLIIMGSHGHGAVYHLLVGSVANGVLKAAPCPVLIVPRPSRRAEG